MNCRFGTGRCWYGPWPCNWIIIPLYFTVFCVILPICCYNCYFSIYYIQKLHLGGVSPGKYARKINDERILQAESFFSERNHDAILLQRANNNITMVIGIVTMKRIGEMKDGEEYHPRYLLQTVAGILQETLPRATRVLICNVEADPSSHTDAVFLSPLVTVVSRYGKRGVTTPPRNLQDKEREDYIFCLNRSLTFNSTYVLLLEDDVLIIPGALDVLDYVLNTKTDDRHPRSTTAAKTITKLFTPRYLQRDFYTAKPSRIVRNLLELLSIGLLGGSLLRIVHIFLRESRESRRLVDRCFIASVVCCILAALAISRPHLLELRRISRQFYMILEANDCCTQAILYSRDIAKDIVAHFQNGLVPDWYPKDVALDYLVKTFGVTAVSVEPNLFTHIGMYSALHEGENIYLKDFS